MGQTNCVVAEMDDLADACKALDIGASYYLAGDFYCRPFEENSKWKSIRPYSDKYVHFRTDNGTIFQFRLDEFHKDRCLLLTSTLRDVFWFFLPHPSIEGTMEIIDRANRVLPHVKGYHKKGDGKKTSRRWGGYFYEFYDRLNSHLDGMKLTPEALEVIYKTLEKKESL